jgi:transglutaminase-like putative cysteine protease
VPQFNFATVLLLALIIGAAAWAAGLLRVQYEEGRLTIFISRARRLRLRFDLRDSWLLFAFALTMGWAVAAAVEHSAWVPDTQGRLVPALALGVAIGWLLVILGASRRTYFAASLLGLVGGLLLLTPSPLTSGLTVDGLRKWMLALPQQPNLQILIGFLAMFLVTGLWTSWWVLERRNGLVGLLPTGTILAVEIINDTNAGLVFYTLVWLAAAASILLRINFVSLKNSWRRRRLPHASDTGWTFGEIGVEATVAILAISFVLPPLSSADISGVLIPGVVHPDSIQFHPFGIGAPGSSGGSVGSIGYSETVRPGSQLKAKSQTVMIVSGDTPAYSPYWRGIALAGWDGISWYQLPSTPDIPVRQQPAVTAGTSVPRDDLPSDPTRVQTLTDTFRVVVPQDQTKGTIFSAGEVLSVKNQAASVRGIMTALPAPPGANAALVNVRGDNQPTASFDTVDRIQLSRLLQPPYSYSVTEVVPKVDVVDLQNAGTNYPSWIAPFVNLYYNGRTATGYSAARDAEIAALARSIVQAAGARTPYDQAKAIEAWFLQKGRFTYTLTPPRAPAGVRPLDYFLFNSKKGFCQDFSTAMNVMLRTLGIPSRQMSGFGLGSYDEKTRQYSVNSLDAHSWVEVYFPDYGWIPFEPTPDGVNTPVNRPTTRDQLSVPLVVPTQANPRVPPNLRDPGVSGGGGLSSSSPFPDLGRILLTALLVVLLLLLIAFVIALRWLMGVGDLPHIWKRLQFLADRLNVRRRSGDTPLEFGARLGRSVPQLDAEVRRLGSLYTRASFRRGGLSADELAEARRAWIKVRASYPGLVARAWRDALRNGKVVSAKEAEASENLEPSRHR